MFDKGELIVSRYVAESINQLIAGRFGHVGLRQLHTKLLLLYKHLPHTAVSQFCMQLTKAYVTETSCNQLID